MTDANIVMPTESRGRRARRASESAQQLTERPAHGDTSALRQRARSRHGAGRRRRQARSRAGDDPRTTRAASVALRADEQGGVDSSDDAARKLTPSAAGERPQLARGPDRVQDPLRRPTSLTNGPGLNHRKPDILPATPGVPSSTPSRTWTASTRSLPRSTRSSSISPAASRGVTRLSG